MVAQTDNCHTEKVRRTSQLRVSLPVDEVEQLRAAAEAEGRSLANYAGHLLSKSEEYRRIVDRRSAA